MIRSAFLRPAATRCFTHTTKNDTKNYKKALTILQSGIDFVIDDKMEAAFYLEIAKAYKGTGNDKEEMKYLQKAKNLKN